MYSFLSCVYYTKCECECQALSLEYIRDKVEDVSDTEEEPSDDHCEILNDGHEGPDEEASDYILCDF